MINLLHYAARRSSDESVSGYTDDVSGLNLILAYKYTVIYKVPKKVLIKFTDGKRSQTILYGCRINKGLLKFTLCHPEND